MEERYITAIDLGTSKILLVVAKLDADGTRLIYGRETPSDGIRYSRVVNPMRAGEAIRYALSLAEDTLGIKCRQVIVGYPRYEVTLKSKCYSASRNEDVCVTAEDLRELRELTMDSYADNSEASEDEVLFGAVGQSFNCGKEKFQIPESEVIGMTTKELGANFKLFVGQAKYVSDMEHAFKLAGDVSVLRKYFTPETTAKAVLYDSEMENGVALIDLGAGISSVSIYIGGVMRHYAAVPFGGRAITTDIKSICAINERLAENIKMAYGACMPDRLQNLGDKTLVIEADEALPSKQLPVQYLSEIITARETEIFNAILYEIQESGFADSLRGVVLTGGGAAMVNVSALFKELSGYSVRIGYPFGKFFKTSLDLGTGGATVLGMVLAAGEEGCVNCYSGTISDEDDFGAVEVEENEETVFNPSPEPPNDTDNKKGKKKEKKVKRQKEGKQEGPVEETSDEGGEQTKGGWTLFDFFDKLSKENV